MMMMMIDDYFYYFPSQSNAGLDDPDVVFVDVDFQHSDGLHDAAHRQRCHEPDGQRQQGVGLVFVLPPGFFCLLSCIPSTSPSLSHTSFTSYSLTLLYLPRSQVHKPQLPSHKHLHSVKDFAILIFSSTSPIQCHERSRRHMLMCVPP